MWTQVTASGVSQGWIRDQNWAWNDGRPVRVAEPLMLPKNYLQRGAEGLSVTGSSSMCTSYSYHNDGTYTLCDLPPGLLRGSPSATTLGVPPWVSRVSQTHMWATS